MLRTPDILAQFLNIAEMLASLGRQSEAEDTYRTLLEQNSDNLAYYRGFLRTKGFDISVYFTLAAAETHRL